MKKVLILLGILSTLSMATIFNPIAGSELNIGYYNHDPSGTVEYNGDVLDTQKDLKWTATNDMFIQAYLEHPLSFIPNIKMGYTELSHIGTGDIESTLNFGGTTFSSNIDTSLNLKMYDLTLYYEIFDDWINADIGLNVKHIDGSMAVNSLENRRLKDFERALPMLYSKIRLDIPTTKLSFQAEGNYVSLNGENIYNAEAGLRYTFSTGIGVEAGYKVIHLKFDNIDDLNLKSESSGTYGKLVMMF